MVAPSSIEEKADLFTLSKSSYNKVGKTHPNKLRKVQGTEVPCQGSGGVPPPSFSPHLKPKRGS